MECGHTKSCKLEIGYGYGHTSGWEGIGVTYRCKRCLECLWFEDDYSCLISNEKDHNNKKRIENLKWKPPKKTGPHPIPKRDRQAIKEFETWIETITS